MTLFKKKTTFEIVLGNLARNEEIRTGKLSEKKLSITIHSVLVVIDNYP